MKLSNRKLSFFVQRVAPGGFDPTFTQGERGAGELRLAGIPAAPARHPLTGQPASIVPSSHSGRAAELGPVLERGAWAPTASHARSSV